MNSRSDEANAASEIEFEKLERKEVSDELLRACRDLFRENYGFWGMRGPRPGESIDLSVNKIREYLCGDYSWLAIARAGERLIGYAMVAEVKSTHGVISWVTQFVVDKDFQNQLVGSTLLTAAWGISSKYAWGIASANPYAVRALEKATRTRCDPAYISNRIATLRDLFKKIPYIQKGRETVNYNESIINTEFYQDLSSVEKRMRTASSETPWRLGKLAEGQEWLAVTFREQPKLRWSEREQIAFERGAHDIVLQAYERMAAARPHENHAWASPDKAEAEVNWIIKRLALKEPASVIDFGCGTGRHSKAFAKLGFQAVGVDFSEVAINHAKNDGCSKGVSFYKGDCRSINFDYQFDLGICLYDVIGSFPDDNDNRKIIRNLINHVKPNGYVAVSVMSYEYTEKKAKKVVYNGSVYDALDNLNSGSIMQDTGNIFDPNYFVLDKRSRVVYRKEVFNQGASLPTELVVRDRRYGLDEIREIIEREGLEVIACGHVRAGSFESVDNADTQPTKEILVLARKLLV
jgi:2-polyprenyl-3-methyl-5-hydroxy-6-metoxy-1,4-benzoquinol methylase